MKKKIILSMVVAAFAIGTVGCGSDDDTVVKDKNTTEDKNITKEPKPKDVKTSLSMSRDQQSEITNIYFEHQGKGVMTLIYVDTDNDASTGYQSDDITKGSEFYMAAFRDGHEKPYFYKVDDANKSKWKLDVNNTDFTYTSSAKSDTIVFKNILITDDYFTAMAQVADKEWTSIDKYTQIKVNDIKMVDNNPSTINGDSNLSMDIGNDDKYISIQLKGEGYLKNTQIFFDTDETNNTGKNIELWKNFGADYMIGTDGKLTKRLADGSNWDYNNSVTIPVLEKNNTIKFSFKRSLLETPDTMKVGTVVSDNHWNVVHTIPERNATTEAPQYTF